MQQNRQQQKFLVSFQRESFVIAVFMRSRLRGGDLIVEFLGFTVPVDPQENQNFLQRETH